MNRGLSEYMRTYLPVMLLTIITVGISGAPSLVAQDTLLPAEAIRIGLLNNFDVRIQRNADTTAVNNRGFGRAGFLPTLDASAAAELSNSDQEANVSFRGGVSDVTAFSAQLALNWTLFDGFRMFINNRRYEQLETISRQRTRDLLENQAVAILQQYYQAVSQRALLDVARESREISAARLEREKVRNDLGGITSSQLYNAEVSYNNDRSLVLERELSLAVAKKELNILLGRAPETEFYVADPASPQPLNESLDQVLNAARERNSQLALARQTIMLAERDIELAQAAFYPRLALNASYAWSDRSTTTDNPLPFPGASNTEELTSLDSRVSLNLSYNLFNGFRDQITQQNAEIERNNAMLELEKTQIRIEGLVRELYLTYVKRLELVELEEGNLSAARRYLDIQEERNRLGLSTSLEFRDAQINIVNVQNTLITARFQALISRARLEQLLGRISVDQ